MFNMNEVLLKVAEVGAAPEVTRHMDREDDRYWVPNETPGVALFPFLFDLTHSAWHMVLRAAPGTVMPRHYHTSRVIVHTLKGRWHYIERDWVQEPGSYLLETPGDVHTFAVVGDEPVELFIINEGANIFVDKDNGITGYADVLVRLGQARRHYADQGLDVSIINGLLR